MRMFVSFYADNDNAVELERMLLDLFEDSDLRSNNFVGINMELDWTEPYFPQTGNFFCSEFMLYLMQNNSDLFLDRQVQFLETISDYLVYVIGNVFWKKDGVHLFINVITQT